MARGRVRLARRSRRARPRARVEARIEPRVEARPVGSRGSEGRRRGQPQRLHGRRGRVGRVARGAFEQTRHSVQDQRRGAQQDEHDRESHYHLGIGEKQRPREIILMYRYMYYTCSSIFGI